MKIVRERARRRRRPQPEEQIYQFFLQATTGRQKIITYGAGVDCTDDDLRPPRLPALMR